jgi:hypothetical protein
MAENDETDAGEALSEDERYWDMIGMTEWVNRETD